MRFNFVFLKTLRRRKTWRNILHSLFVFGFVFCLFCLLFFKPKSTRRNKVNFFVLYAFLHFGNEADSDFLSSRGSRKNFIDPERGVHLLHKNLENPYFFLNFSFYLSKK